MKDFGIPLVLSNFCPKLWNVVEAKSEKCGEKSRRVSRAPKRKLWLLLLVTESFTNSNSLQPAAQNALKRNALILWSMQHNWVGSHFFKGILAGCVHPAKPLRFSSILWWDHSRLNTSFAAMESKILMWTRLGHCYEGLFFHASTPCHL